MSPSSRSPLIELLRDRPVSVPVRSRGGERAVEGEAVPPDDHDPMRWLAPGRVLRIPVGYLMVAAAAFIALGVGAYSIGYEVAESRVRRDFARTQATLGEQPSTPARDPLLADVDEAGPGSTAERPGRTSPQTDSAPSQSGVGSETVADAGERGGGPAPLEPGVDPRQPGMNYVVLLLTSVDEADRAAAFLRRNGVRAGVFPANRPGWRHVIALRGFPAGTLDSAEFRRYKARLMELGQVWKRDHRGASDFSDMWEQKYDP